MQFAIDKYKVDMVVGNLLNNKSWIKIKINNKNNIKEKNTNY